MRVTICNWDARPERFSAQADALSAHVSAEGSQLVLLPEMPFTPWLAFSQAPDQGMWDQSVRDHEKRIGELSGLVKAAIAGSRPIVRNGVNFNEAFVWSQGAFQAVGHQKRWLPAEDWYWEANWYRPGVPADTPTPFADLKLGFAICTEVWDSDHGRRLASAGADAILVPRATPDFGNDIWVAGLRALAVQTGCYVLSSNFAYARTEDFEFEGLAMASDPDGITLALATEQEPFVTIDVSAENSAQAKSTYPRYIIDDPKKDDD